MPSDIQFNSLKSVGHSKQLNVAIRGVNNDLFEWSYLKLLDKAASSSLSFNPKSKDEEYHKSTSTLWDFSLDPSDVDTFINIFSLELLRIFYASRNEISNNGMWISSDPSLSLSGNYFVSV